MWKVLRFRIGGCLTNEPSLNDPGTRMHGMRHRLAKSNLGLNTCEEGRREINQEKCESNISCELDPSVAPKDPGARSVQPCESERKP